MSKILFAAGRGGRNVEPLENRLLLASIVPGGFTDELVAGGLSAATAMEFAPDGRLFVAQQGGALRVIQNGTLLSTPFVTLDVDSVGERGLLGVAFDPDFANTGFVYLYRTVPNGPDGASGAFNQIIRYTAVDADPGPGYAPGNTAQSASAQVVLNLSLLSGATNHNGGAIHFSPVDGKLYAAVGENANPNHAQTLANHHGKILRLNPDGSAPADNPFNDADANPAEPRDYIWALGLRNPFTTAFQPGTGRFYINDVGQNSWEEVNEGAAGANYGWPTYEGPESDANFGTPPIYAYSHSAGGNDGGNVISGGTFYNPPVARFPAEYVGDYFFAEAGRGWIRHYDPATDTATLFATSMAFPVDLKTGTDGSLYYLERGSSSVRRIRFNTMPAPSAPDLAPASDSGASDTDNLTNRDNSAGSKTLQFSVGNTIPGATVTLFADNVAIGSAFATGAVTTVTTNGTSDLADGFRVFTARQTQGGVQSAVSPMLAVTIDTAAPAVSDVFVSGSNWTATFLNYFGTSGLGDAAAGFRLLAADHADELPWTNLNQISVRFSEGVNVAAGDLVVHGVRIAEYVGFNFAYNAATFTATWTLPPTTLFDRDKLLLDLDADGGGVIDASGNALDGEWTNPTAPANGADSFPSGDSIAGGDFRFRLNVLPGDVNRSGGAVVGSDVTLTRNAQNSTPGAVNSLYTIFKDVNGSGSILGSDVTLVRNRQGYTLPAGEPAPTALTETTSVSLAHKGMIHGSSLFATGPKVRSAMQLLAARFDLLGDAVDDPLVV